LIDESVEIAAYFESTCPAKPIFLNGSEMLVRIFDSVYLDDAHPVARLLFWRTAEILNSVGTEFFQRTRSEALQLPWQEVSPEGPKRDGDWAHLEHCFDKPEELRAKCNGTSFMGDRFSYADIVVARRLF
jgi:glutathione S-transferase